MSAATTTIVPAMRSSARSAATSSSQDISGCSIRTPTSRIAQSSGFELGQFNFADWRSINADFLVKGSVNASGGGVKLTAYLYDVAQQRRMMGKNYSGDAGDVPRMARRFADAILEAATGTKGPFDSKLAFVSTGGGRFKEVLYPVYRRPGFDQVDQQSDHQPVPEFRPKHQPSAVPLVQDAWSRRFI